MFSAAREQLKLKLLLSLEQGSNKILIQDDHVAWTGSQIRAHIQSLQTVLDSATEPGCRVGISFPNRAVKALSILAVIASGRVPVVMSFSDLSSAPEEWIERAEISFLFTATGVEKTLGSLVPFVTLSLLDASIENSFVNGVKAISYREEKDAKSADGTGVILFTSGSTGKPKGILVPAEGILKTAEFLKDYFELNENTVAPILLPIYHSMALNTQFLPTFLAGGKCHFMDASLGINRVYRTILEQKGTFASLTGEVLRVCGEERARRKLPAAELVQHIQLAGDMISRHHVQLATGLFPNAVVHKGYGLTEAIRVTMINNRQPGFFSSSVGSPLPFVNVEIRDENGKLRPKYKLGKIFVKGPTVLLGHAGLATQPVDTDGFLCTGDMGYWNSDGQICVAGREDGLFKINGHRISGFEIERIATEASAMVRTARCLALEDSQRAGKKIVLLLEVPAEFLWSFVKTEIKVMQKTIHHQLQSMSHFPREITILEAFPRTSNGKVAMRRLAEIYMSSNKMILSENTHSGLRFFRLPMNDLKGATI